MSSGGLTGNHQLFLDFLALLRTKYLAAARGKDATFHSVILAGVHDVKTLKLKIRPDEPFDSAQGKYNSPWNIAVDFTVDLRFNSQEIQTMLAEFEFRFNRRRSGRRPLLFKRVMELGLKQRAPTREALEMEARRLRAACSWL